MAKSVKGPERILPELEQFAIALDQVNLDTQNARAHDARNIDAIMASLLEFGQRFPILVQKTGMVVRAGNARVIAARQLGWERIAALVVDEPDKVARRFSLMDNRTGELAQWDRDMLRELAELPEINLTELGWEPSELEALLSDDEPATTSTGEGSGSGAALKDMAFSLTDSQARFVNRALDKAAGKIRTGAEVNPDMRANALVYICRDYLAK